MPTGANSAVLVSLLNFFLWSTNFWYLYKGTTKQSLKQHFKKLHQGDVAGETVLKTRGKSILSTRQTVGNSCGKSVSVLKQEKIDMKEITGVQAPGQKIR